MKDLLAFYHPTGNERVGLILKDGTIVELPNQALNPSEGSKIDIMDLIHYEDLAMATFHTHPGESSDLSLDDHKAFSNWPEFKHYIVGKDGVSCYSIKGKSVVRDA